MHVVLRNLSGPSRAVLLAVLVVLPTGIAGSGWTPVPVPGSWGTPWITDFAFPAPDVGVAAGIATGFRTTDGGDTWTPIPTLEGAFFHGMDSLGPVVAAAGVNWIFQPFVAYSPDAGLTWSTQFAYINNNEATLRDVHVVAPDVLVAVGHLWTGQGFIVLSLDRGSSWNVIQQAPVPILGMDFAADRLRGVAVGWDGSAYLTLTGGLTWTPVATGTSAALWDVAWSGLFDVVAVGAQGTILRSTDSGVTWAAVESDTIAQFNAVRFSPTDTARGYAAGMDGRLLGTTDSGASWHAEDLGGVSAPLHALAFSAEGSRAFVAGQADRIWVDG